ncbi:MAG: hypothetical protein KIH08_15540 [Candidatus Freyarchaeota archaeon]|nr:hypothetical protein [Candidatus Jordarchaeia archaeon]MBS7269699.1 hypothetical protein [Candidatus Jordarchaeia archaeon]MBS7280581.1 hypothetical protein [Candidatus Jordarchaeia archaeon]
MRAILDNWFTAQKEETKHYCQVCGTPLKTSETQNSETQLCPKHKDLSQPNTLLIDGKLFKATFKTLQRILKKHNTRQLTLQVSRDGLHIQYLDPSHVSLTKIHLYVKAFKALNIDYTQPKTLTINVDELKILQKIEEKDEILIHFGEENIQLSLLGKNYNHSLSEKSFYLELLHNPLEEISEPQLKFQATIQIKASALIQALQKIKNQANSENTYFECAPNTFQIYAHDYNNNKLSENFNKTMLLKIQAENDVSSMYNSDYILTLFDGLKQYINNIQIHYSNNTPILITANLSKSKHENHHSYLGHVKYYQAPRVLHI